MEVKRIPTPPFRVVAIRTDPSFPAWFTDVFPRCPRTLPLQMSSLSWLLHNPATITTPKARDTHRTWPTRTPVSLVSRHYVRDMRYSLVGSNLWQDTVSHLYTDRVFGAGGVKIWTLYMYVLCVGIANPPADMPALTQLHLSHIIRHDS